LRPPYVTSLDSYLDWIEVELEASGGYLADEVLIFEYLQSGPGAFVGLLIPKHRLVFHNETFLDFSLLVSERLTCENYSYHFQQQRGTLLWRKDMHDADHHGLGQVAHIHDPEEVVHPYREVDLSEALSEIYTYQDTGKLPTL
jgi:hypothetical protein